MQTLSISETRQVAGGYGFMARFFARELFKAGVFNAILAGPGPASRSTGGWGVVGFGNFGATNPSSAMAVNGHDRESDDYARRMNTY